MHRASKCLKSRTFYASFISLFVQSVVLNMMVSNMTSLDYIEIKCNQVPSARYISFCNLHVCDVHANENKMFYFYLCHLI